MAKLYKHDLILDLSKGKTVLHIGACDSPYHIERGQRGALLHQKLQKVCKRIIGIDVDEKAIEELSDLGVKSIFWGDITRNAYRINLREYDFDCIIFGDVIEHLENPGVALDNIKDLMIRKNTKLILTAPNCFSYGAVRNILTKREKVHADHVLWTSYKTLTQLFARKNLRIDYSLFCFYGSYKESRMRNKLAYKILPKHLLPCLFFSLKLGTPARSYSIPNPPTRDDISS